jgi:hypothetical protein
MKRKILHQTEAARRGRRWDHPLAFSWSHEGGPNPVPIAAVRPLRPLPQPLFLGLQPGPFQFTYHMRALIQDIRDRTPDLNHINLDFVLVGISRARTRRPFGLQAKVTPMRFKNGDRIQKRRGWIYQVQQFYVNGVEMLYLLSFCLPRFQDLTFDEKMITIFHELFHMAPEFNGDLRRHHGRYYQHSHSKKKYDLHMQQYVQAYFDSKPDLGLTEFLRFTFEQLHERHGGVQGIMVPVPKLVPVLS